MRIDVICESSYDPDLGYVPYMIRVDSEVVAQRITYNVCATLVDSWMRPGDTYHESNSPGGEASKFDFYDHVQARVTDLMFRAGY